MMQTKLFISQAIKKKKQHGKKYCRIENHTPKKKKKTRFTYIFTLISLWVCLAITKQCPVDTQQQYMLPITCRFNHMLSANVVVVWGNYKFAMYFSYTNCAAKPIDIGICMYIWYMHLMLHIRSIVDVLITPDVIVCLATWVANINSRSIILMRRVKLVLQLWARQQ